MAGSAEATRWLIVGAGGFGREVFTWASSDPARAGTSVDICFLDDDPACLDRFPKLQARWAGRISDYVPEPRDRLLMALGDPRVKLDVARQLLDRGAIFESFVHSTAIVAPDAQLGRGCILCPYAVVSCHVRLGDLVTLNLSAIVGHDAVLGDGCSLSPHAAVTGEVRLGQAVFLGCHSCVLPGLKVGDFARIGAGSVVVSPVKAGWSVIGVPAARLNLSSSESISPAVPAA